MAIINYILCLFDSRKSSQTSRQPQVTYKVRWSSRVLQMQYKTGICRKSANFSEDFAAKNVIFNQICNIFAITISADQTT